MTQHSIPVLTPLDYHPGLAVTLFAPLAHLPGAVLLHSGDAQHQHNRFDILTADPFMTLTTRGDDTFIEDNRGQCRCEKSDPFRLLDDALAQSGFSPCPQDDYPFMGGALGLWGYDLGRRTESLPSLARNELKIPDMAVGLYDWAIIVDNHRRCATLITYDDPAVRLAWLQVQRNAIPAQTVPFALTGNWQSDMSEAEYHEKIARIHEYLQAGDCYQVNLAQCFTAPYEGDEWQAFLLLNAENKAPFSAFLRLPETAVISVSPERFLWLKDGTVQTRPIKGTRPRHPEDEQADEKEKQALAASEKDRAENLMIVDLMRNDIGRVARPGSVSVPSLFAVEAFPAVYHLVSTITAELPPQCHAADLLRACFPGGSITGAPKIRAMEIIEELEPCRRHAYCGSIGYISFCGTMDTNIAIRTLIAEDNRLYCKAGGGIVADSRAADEYQETFDKLGRILPVLPEK
ncbi:aminodeoxychorismate synthase component 1 [Morganella psychrotolerans]|uniref:aminodeoxychorismate synthase n=1 Tax=Morganella psychrotolerans TaxID=368603 RepID=A0A1B8HTW9_9GAMM|nr:aminodeoxychorismate synthase component 1 [Morganella psychrotolerans]OBU13211.1 aminodeoxychorismate synthase, component I [Morganella psychrotolerans]